MRAQGAFVAVLGFFALACGARGQEVPAFQASLVPGCALHEPDQRIQGLALSVWGENPQKALAVGLVNGATGDSEGLSFGGMNYAERYAGVQWSFANFTGGDCSGWQGGPIFGLLGSAVNYAGGRMSGAQTGLVNLAGRLSGAQVGIVNYAQFAESGVQVGLVNLIAQNRDYFSRWPDEVAPAMILVNWRFGRAAEEEQ